MRARFFALMATGSIEMWLLFVSWFIHDVEEFAFFRPFNVDQDSRIQELIEKRPFTERLFRSFPKSRKQLGISIAVVGAIVLTANLVGYYWPTKEGILIYAVFLGGYFLHGFP